MPCSSNVCNGARANGRNGSKADTARNTEMVGTLAPPVARRWNIDRQQRSMDPALHSVIGCVRHPADPEAFCHPTEQPTCRFCDTRSAFRALPRNGTRCAWRRRHLAFSGRPLTLRQAHPGWFRARICRHDIFAPNRVGSLEGSLSPRETAGHSQPQIPTPER